MAMSAPMSGAVHVRRRRQWSLSLLSPLLSGDMVADLRDTAIRPTLCERPGRRSGHLDGVRSDADGDVQMSAQGNRIGPQCLELHRFDLAVLDLGDAGLGHTEDFGKLGLGLPDSLAQLPKMMAGDVGIEFGARLRLPLRAGQLRMAAVGLSLDVSPVASGPHRPPSLSFSAR